MTRRTKSAGPSTLCDTQDWCEGREKTSKHVSEWRLSTFQGLAVKGFSAFYV